MDPVRSPLPPVAQFLAEAALQRQGSLLGLDRAQPVATPPGSPPPLPSLPVPPASAAIPLPVPADKANISTQAREQWGAGFDLRGATAAPPSGGRASSGLLLAAAPLPAAAAPAAAPVAAAWPTAGLGAPVLRMVSALVQQLTAGAVPQRVVAAQPWPLALAQALESGTADRDAPPLQTWLVRQGTVQTPEGPRGFALTLRVPVPWLAALAPAPSVPPTAQAPLQAPFAGPAQSLQSGVFALVLQGMEAAAPRTSALLVLDFQPHLAATVYGRDMLQARLDPWTQMAVLQASGQVPRGEEDRARNGASGLCETLGCPYERRAACAQPFCAALRWVEPSAPSSSSAPLA